MFPTLINRTIFLELLKVFLLSLVAITSLLLLAGVISEASREGLAPHQILAILPLIIPSTLPYTIPTTTLFACCVIYGRLAADNEILAIKSAGVNILRVLAPGLFLGLAMSGVTFALYYSLIPTTHYLMRTLFLQDPEGLLYAILEREGSFRHPRLDYEIDVRRVQGRKLLDAQFMHRDPHSKRIDLIARAKEAELLWDQNNKKIHVHMRFCTIRSDRSDTYVEDKVYDVDVPEDLGPRGKFRPSDMTWRELRQARAALLDKLEKHRLDSSLQDARWKTSNPPDDLPQQVIDLQNLQKRHEQELLDLSVEMHKRPALALGCLCFVLIGCPVGIWFSRSDYLSAFVVCFLPIVLLYYPLLLCGMNLARGGKLSLALGMWGANALVGLISLGLYRQLLRT